MMSTNSLESWSTYSWIHWRGLWHPDRHTLFASHPQDRRSLADFSLRVVLSALSMWTCHSTAHSAALWTKRCKRHTVHHQHRLKAKRHRHWRRRCRHWTWDGSGSCQSQSAWSWFASDWSHCLRASHHYPRGRAAAYVSSCTWPSCLRFSRCVSGVVHFLSAQGSPGKFLHSCIQAKTVEKLEMSKHLRVLLIATYQLCYQMGFSFSDLWENSGQLIQIASETLSLLWQHVVDSERLSLDFCEFFSSLLTQGDSDFTFSISHDTW